MAGAVWGSEWTVEDRCRFAAKLPWTIVPAAMEDGMLVVRVKELPGFLATGETEQELASSFFPAIESFLLSFFADGEEPPRPALVGAFPWDASRAPAPVQRIEPFRDLLSESGGSTEEVRVDRDRVLAAAA